MANMRNAIWGQTSNDHKHTKIMWANSAKIALKKWISFFKLHVWLADEWTDFYTIILLSYGHVSHPSAMLCQENARIRETHNWAAVITTWVDCPNNSDLGLYKSYSNFKIRWSLPT